MMAFKVHTSRDFGQNMFWKICSKISSASPYVDKKLLLYNIDRSDSGDSYLQQGYQKYKYFSRPYYVFSLASALKIIKMAISGEM